jgi:hypothetical protein
MLSFTDGVVYLFDVGFFERNLFAAPQARWGLTSIWPAEAIVPPR